MRLTRHCRLFTSLHSTLFTMCRTQMVCDFSFFFSFFFWIYNSAKLNANATERTNTRARPITQEPNKKKEPKIHLQFVCTMYYYLSDMHTTLWRFVSFRSYIRSLGSFARIFFTFLRWRLMFPKSKYLETVSNRFAIAVVCVCTDARLFSTSLAMLESTLQTIFKLISFARKIHTVSR